jgi:hypothetical protein
MSLIESLTFSENIVDIFQGSHGKYYCVQENKEHPEIKNNEDNIFPIYYDIHFPLEWVLHKNSFLVYGEVHTPGPNSCDNCKSFGYYKGVFIGYCMNCANCFKYKRGNGMTDLCKEVDENMKAFDLSNYKKENSMWNTYLKDVNLNKIGDDKLEEEREIYKDLPDLIPMEHENENENENESNYSKQFVDSDDEIDYESKNYYDTDEEEINIRKDKFIDCRKFDRYS